MYLVGASGHAKVIIDILERRKITIEGLFDKDEKIKSLRGYSVYPEDHIDADHKLLVSIGDNLIRKRVVDKLYQNLFFNAIHPQSTLDNSVELGVGIAIMAGVIINADTIIGNHAIINTSASVDHDCKISDFAHVAPNASLCGGIKIGKATLVGAGATVAPNISIGMNVLVGAGSVVIEDVPDNVLVAGNPAKIIRKL